MNSLNDTTLESNTYMKINFEAATFLLMPDFFW